MGNGRGIRRVAAVAGALIALAGIRSAFADDECLVDFQATNLSSSGQVCGEAVDRKCTFSVDLCLNQDTSSTCQAGTFKKKKIKAQGSCVGGRVFVVPNGTSNVCGAPVQVVVKTKKKGTKAGTCTIKATAKTTDGRTDQDSITLTCNPQPNTCPTTTTTAAPTTTTTSAASTTTTESATTTTSGPTTTTTGSTSSTTEMATTTTSTTTTTEPQIQCCVQSSPGGAFDSSMGSFDTCVILSATGCAAQGGIGVGAGICEPNPCPPTTTTTVEATTTTTAEATTTTTTEATTTTTTTLPVCCDATRIETLSSDGTLEVSTLPAFPFPANVHTVIEVGTGDEDCKHTGIVPAGGFTVPVFCIPALQFTSSVTAVGCESGGADGAAVVWDSTSTNPQPDITRLGDTSDPADNGCGTLGTGCVTTAGGAGADTAGNIDTTRGGNANGVTGKVHTQVDIPVHSITWIAADASCPDTDGTFDEGTDTPVTDFFFILSPTTGHTTADYTDLNGDGCTKAGNGPLNKTADGVPADGPCCTVGQATTVSATGIAFTGGAPLYDITFRSITPTTISACDVPASADTCTLTTNTCQD